MSACWAVGCRFMTHDILQSSHMYHIHAPCWNGLVIRAGEDVMDKKK
jgi:hypothetical protein